MLRKNRIENNFSRASKTYNIATPTQKVCAEKLFELISKKEFTHVLEIGAGTGYLTNLIVKNFNSAEFLINDLSQSMLDEIKVTGANISKFTADAEDLPFTENGMFDLITSSSVFQWFEEYESTFTKYNELLTDDGELVFSMYGENTLQELKEVFKKFLPEHNPNLKIKTFEEIKSYLEAANFDIEIAQEQEFTKQFLSLTEILQHQKLSGAVNVNPDSKNHISKKTWMQIIDDYKKTFTKNDGVFATYHLYYFKAKKRTL